MNVKDINFGKYKRKAEALIGDRSKVQELLRKSASKIATVVENNDQLKGFVDHVKLMMRMIKAQISGEYKEFPTKSVVMVAGALIYFISPLDFIPDLIPALGLTDDAAIVFWVYKNIQEDIEKFRQWELSRQV